MCQDFRNHHEHRTAREEEGQMSGMQGNQHRPAIRVVLREDLSKELSFLAVRGDRPSVPIAVGKFWFAVVTWATTAQSATKGAEDEELRQPRPTVCWFLLSRMPG